MWTTLIFVIFRQEIKGKSTGRAVWTTLFFHVDKNVEELCKSEKINNTHIL